MAHIIADRVYDTTTTTGTGAVAVSGTAPTGFRTFSAVMTTNDTCYYSIAHQSANEWEVGLGTYSSANTLTRTTVYSSSNANAAVSFSTGTKDVILTFAASRSLQLDNAGNVGIGLTPSYKLDVSGAIRNSSGALVASKTNVSAPGLGLVVGTVDKATNQSASNGVIGIYTDDAANQLQAALTLNTNSTAANRRLTISCIEQGVAFRPITLNETGGNVGIGTAAPTNILSIGGNSAQTVWLERHTTSNTAGNNLTVQAGGATSAATDKNGGNLILSSGTATGTGSSNVIINTATAGATGTADRAPAENLRLAGDGTLFVRSGTSTTNTNSSKIVSGGTISETVGSTQYLALSQYDVGTAADQVPLNQYLGKNAYVDSEWLSLDVGTGITTGSGTICKASAAQMGGMYLVRILIDLRGLNSGGTAGDIIGVNGTALGCYIALIPSQITVLGGRMICLEAPATATAQIDLGSATVATGVEDGVFSSLTGQATALTAGSAWAAGDTRLITTMPGANTYLYLVGQGATGLNATYSAGRYLIEMFGY